MFVCVCVCVCVSFSVWCGGEGWVGVIVCISSYIIRCVLSELFFADILSLRPIPSHPPRILLCCSSPLNNCTSWLCVKNKNNPPPPPPQNNQKKKNQLIYSPLRCRLPRKGWASRTRWCWATTTTWSTAPSFPSRSSASQDDLKPHPRPPTTPPPPCSTRCIARPHGPEAVDFHPCKVLGTPHAALVSLHLIGGSD